MNPNPTGQPFDAPPQGSPPPTARDALNVPGILFIVIGGIGVLFALMGLLSSGANREQLLQVMNDPNLPPQAKDLIVKFSSMGKVFNLVALLFDGLVIFGGIQMRKLKMYPLAVATAFVAMIPCQCVCCLGIPVGIWALTILFKPEVRAQFT
jgi:uncharacterized membrane protein